MTEAESLRLDTPGSCFSFLGGRMLRRQAQGIQGMKRSVAEALQQLRDGMVRHLLAIPCFLELRFMDLQRVQNMRIPRSSRCSRSGLQLVWLMRLTVTSDDKSVWPRFWKLGVLPPNMTPARLRLPTKCRASGTTRQLTFNQASRPSGKTRCREKKGQRQQPFKSWRAAQNEGDAQWLLTRWKNLPT